MADTQILTQISAAVAALHAEHHPKVFGVGGERVPQRSGIAVSERRVLSVARQAEAGEKVPLRTADGTVLTATVLGWDPATELALLETEQNHGVAVWERAGETPAVGTAVVSLGMPSEAGVEARFDIVRSASDDGRYHHVRTDGVALPGFAGGGMIDPDGRLIAVLTRDPHGFSGFGIGANYAFELVKDLEGGASRGPAYLGIQGHPVDLSPQHRDTLGREQTMGLLLMSIEEGSPSSKAGLTVGDIVVAMNGTQIPTHEELFHQLASGLVGKTVAVEVLRGGKVTTLNVVPVERPHHAGHHAGHRGGHHGGQARGGAHRRWRGMGTMG